MKKWQIGICVTCAAVLAGMFLFSSGAQAGIVVPQGSTAKDTARGRVEIIDVEMVTTCARPGPFSKLLDTVDAESRNLGTRLSREAAAALLQHGLLVIELPGYAPLSAPALPKLVGVLED